MKASKRYYVTEWRPNGTHDLIITDEDNQIIDVIEEAVFGIRLEERGILDGGENLACFETVIVCDESGVFSVDAYTLDDYSEVERVYQVEESVVLRHVAVSPVCDGSAVLKALKN